MANKCSLNAAAGSDCSSSRGLEEFTKLNNCIDDITTHLAKCHLSKKRISERNLILMRAGLYCQGEKNIEGMTVQHIGMHLVSFGSLQQRASIPNMQEKQLQLLEPMS